MLVWLHPKSKSSNRVICWLCIHFWLWLLPFCKTGQGSSKATLPMHTRGRVRKKYGSTQIFGTQKFANISAFEDIWVNLPNSLAKVWENIPRSLTTGVSPGLVHYWRNALNRKRLFVVQKSRSIRYQTSFFCIIYMD